MERTEWIKLIGLTYFLGLIAIMIGKMGSLVFNIWIIIFTLVIFIDTGIKTNWYIEKELWRKIKNVVSF